MTTATYVLVHGSNANSFSWGPLQRELALLGHRSLAVDLPGHGFAAAYSRAYQAPQDLAALASAPSGFARHRPGRRGRARGGRGAPGRRARSGGAGRAQPVPGERDPRVLDDGTDAEFLAFLNTLEPDEGLDAGADRVEAATWDRTPRSYVRPAGDRSIPPALQDRFIREADALTPDNPFDVHALDSSHAGFLVRPADAARLPAGLAG